MTPLQPDSRMATDQRPSKGDESPWMGLYTAPHEAQAAIPPAACLRPGGARRRRVRASGEVTRVDVTSRKPVGTSGYEKIVGIAHFAVDPKDPHNRVIADIDKAPVNAAGQVEFSGDIVILRPLDAADPTAWRSSTSSIAAGRRS